MDQHLLLRNFISSRPDAVSRVIDFNPEHDKLLQFDFTAANTQLSAEVIADTRMFSEWVSRKLAGTDCRYGTGGYMEHRTLYARSEHFGGDGEPRRLHLGVDLWAEAGTAVYAAFNGKIHSFQDNPQFGDYGPTIILQHNLDGLTLYTLYGHLSRADLRTITEGQSVSAGQRIGAFGHSTENGSWPPHLHFQMMFAIGTNKGDYPGVGYYSKKEEYLLNMPDPALVLQFPEGQIMR
jgi:murein DD-endopeptidase MepM/ murein hydrolase activator NlpD